MQLRFYRLSLINKCLTVEVVSFSTDPSFRDISVLSLFCFCFLTMLLIGAILIFFCFRFWSIWVHVRLLFLTDLQNQQKLPIIDLNISIKAKKLEFDFSSNKFIKNDNFQSFLRHFKAAPIKTKSSLIFLLQKHVRDVNINIRIQNGGRLGENFS